MKTIEFDDLPIDIQKKFKKEHTEKTIKLYKEMGIELTSYHEELQWIWALKDTFFIEEAGNVYLSFKPKKI